MKKPATDYSARVLAIFRSCQSASVLPDVSKLISSHQARIPQIEKGCLVGLKIANRFNTPATVHGVVFTVWL